MARIFAPHSVLLGHSTLLELRVASALRLLEYLDLLKLLVVNILHLLNVLHLKILHLNGIFHSLVLENKLLNVDLAAMITVCGRVLTADSTLMLRDHSISLVDPIGCGLDRVDVLVGLAAGPSPLAEG